MFSFEKLSKSNMSEGGQEKESSEALRTEALQAIEETLKKEIEQRAPSIPKEERKLEPVTNQAGDQVALIERVRQSEHGDPGGRDLWLIVDLDDVANRTTTYHNDMFNKLAEQSSMTEEELQGVWENSKLPNEAGKKVLQFSVFVDSVKERSPDAEGVDRVIKELDYGGYVDQAVKRALIAARLSHVYDKVRISILTYGEAEYQKMRIDKTDLADVVDDVIYTEGSKQETVAALLEEYRSENYPTKGEISAPFIITIDDSPEHVDDYDKIPLERRYANVRFRHPQAKQFKKPHAAKKVIESEESAPNQAAVNIFKMAKLATSQFAQQDREEVQRLLNKPKAYDNLLSHWGGYRRDENIIYQKEGNHIIRECDISFESDRPAKHHKRQDLGKVMSDGTLSTKLTGDTDVGFEEFIREARPKDIKR